MLAHSRSVDGAKIVVQHKNVPCLLPSPPNYGRPIFRAGAAYNPNSRALSSLPPQFQESMAWKPLVHPPSHGLRRTGRMKPKGQLKRIPRRFHQIALHIRFSRWPHINVVRFRRPGFLPAHFRRLIKRQLREFPQQIRMRRHHLLFLGLIQIPKSRRETG